METLFDRVVAATNLSGLIATGAVRRAFERVGVNVNTLAPSDIPKAIASLRQCLSVYFPPDEVEKHLVEIIKLSRTTHHTRGA